MKRRFHSGTDQFIFSIILQYVYIESGGTFQYVCTSIVGKELKQKVNAVKTSENLSSSFRFLLMDLKGLLYLIVKIRGRIDMTITWSVKTPLDGKKVVARSWLLVPAFIYYILPVRCR